MRAETPANPSLNAKAVAPQPGFVRAFRGIWLLIGRAQFSRVRLAGMVAGILSPAFMAWLTVEPRATEAYLRWVVDFYFMLLLPFYCLATCGSMIREEIQADTLRFLITRPLPRWQLLVITYLCHGARLVGITGLSAVLLLGVGVARSIPDVLPFAGVLFGCQFLAVVAYGALSSLLGLISPRYMLLGIIYGTVVEMGIGRIPTNINNLSISRHLRALLANHDAIEKLYSWSPEGTAKSILLLLAMAVVLLGVAAVLFSVREYHATEEMQK